MGKHRSSFAHRNNSYCLAWRASDEFSAKISSGKNNNYYLLALTGIRFFAIFHIFLFHLWSMYRSEKPDDMANLLMGFNDAPKTLGAFLSNGWISTSLFFLLSGFILAYLYWGEDGQLVTTKRRFWSLRFARIYPIHLIVMAIMLLLQVPWYLGQDMPLSTLIPSALASIALVQAWIPPLARVEPRFSKPPIRSLFL